MTIVLLWTAKFLQDAVRGFVLRTQLKGKLENDSLNISYFSVHVYRACVDVLTRYHCQKRCLNKLISTHENTHGGELTLIRTPCLKPFTGRMQMRGTD